MLKVNKNSESVTILAKKKLSQTPGKPVARIDLVKYINNEVGKDYFTEGMLARGIANIPKDNDYEKVDYGVYRKILNANKECLYKQKSNDILTNACINLREVISELDNHIKKNIGTPSSSLDELEELVKTTKYIKNMIELIEEKMD